MTLHDVAPLTEILRLGALGAVFLGLSIATFVNARDPSSVGYRAWNRYTGGLERKLRAMFLFIPGRRIAIGQLAAAFAYLTLRIFVVIPYFWAGMLVIAVAPALYVEHLRRARVERIEMQLDGFLLALANGLKTTPSIGAALAAVVHVVQSPIRQELELALKEMKVGSSMDQALLHLAARVGSRQLDAALSSILIGRQVGGNLPKVLETTSATLREMQRLEGVVRTKTAEGRFQLVAIGLLPFVLVFILNEFWPGYFQPLQGSFVGYVMIAAAGGFWIAAIALARKVLAVDI